MRRIDIVYYSIYSLIFIFIIIYFIVLFSNRDIQLAGKSYIKSKFNSKCYDIMITDKKVINDLYDIMEGFDKAANEVQLPYVACAGTLLGAIRHNKIIPWDDDLDIIVDVDDIDKLTHEVFPLLYKMGFTIQLHSITKYYRVMKEGTIHPFMDIFLYSKNGKYLKPRSRHYSLMYPKERKLPIDMIYPIKRYKLGDIEISGPAKPREYLKKIYSPKVFDEIAGTFFDHNTLKAHKLCKKKIDEIDPKYL